jgi:hypothetical protein
MKTLRQIVLEVAQPKSGDEKHFKDKHIVTKIDHPVAPDHVFTGKTVKAPKRRADYDKGEDEAVYEGSFDVPTAEGGDYDSEDSHTKYKKGNKSTKVMKEVKKTDTVGQEDDDIDNDGDVDSSDKYLHARRRAIAKAVKKEEAEIDEAAPKIKPDFVKTQREKDRSHDASMGRTPTGRKKVMTSTQRSMASMRKEAKEYDPGHIGAVQKMLDKEREAKKAMKKEEAEQLDELSPRVKASYLTKAKADQKSAQKRYTKGAYRNDGANFFDADTPEMEKDAKRMEKRRKGIAMAKEEVDLNESNDASVERSLSAHRIKQAAKVKAGIPLRRPGEGLAAYVTRKAKAQAKMQKEEVELSESIDQIKKHHVSNIAHFDNHSSPDTALSVHHQRMTRLHSDAASKAKQSGNKKMADAHSSAANAHRSANGTVSAFNRAVEKTKQTFNESLNEVSKKTLGSYADKARAQRGAGKDREKGISMAVRKSTASAENPYDRGPRVRATEEAEQLDELSPKTLASYVKKAQKSSDKHFDKAGMALAKSQDAGERAHKSDTDRGYDYHKDREAKHDQKFRDHDRMHRKRETGITRANRRIGESVEQLDESITKMSSARLKFHATKKIPHGSFSNAEIEDEHDRRKKTDPNYHRVKPSLSEVTRSAVKKAVTYTGSDGKSHTRNVPLKRVDRDEHGQEKIRESVELDEAFKIGMLKLNDGSPVILRKEDVDVLNSLFKSLSSTNRKKMESIAMKDKNGFNEILSFAREAL